MSEYKENTVGWWLSQLKEPLRSLAFGVYRKPEFLYRPAKKMCDATNILSWSIKGDTAFWDGVDAFFRQDVTRDHLYPSRWKGWDMANKCAPDNWLKPKDGGEDKAIVDSPKKTRELFFYADETLINPLRNPLKEPLTISPSGEMLSVIVDEDKIKDLMNANPDVVFWPANVQGFFPDREIEAPQPAVVGYEIPLPIDTIEKKHELRIQNLEGQVKYLEDMVGSLLRSLEIITKQLPKN